MYIKCLSGILHLPQQRPNGHKMKAKLSNSLIKTLKPEDKQYEVWDSEIKGFYLLVTPKGAMTYYLFYRHEGTKRKFKLGKGISATVARDRAKAKTGELAHDIDIQAEKVNTRKKNLSNKHKTLEGFIKHKYKDWVLNNRKSGNQTLATLETHFSQFNKRALDDINTWIIDKWRTDRLKTGIAKSTINRNVAALKSMLAKAVEWGDIEVHPLSKLKPLKTDNSVKVRYLSDSEDENLRAALLARDTRMINERESANQWRKQRDYIPHKSLTNSTYADHLTPMTLLSINTGLRRGEVFNMNWEDINFNTNSLVIHGTTAKSGSTRHIPLNPEALNVLGQWKKIEHRKGLVFPNKEGKPFHTIKKSWGNILKAAKITSFRWHDLRHDFASKLVMAGVPLNTVRELLGHSDISTTLRYAHLAPDHKAEAVERISKAFK